MKRIYIYVKDEPTVINDRTIADGIFDDHGKAARWLADRASLPDPTPTQDEKLQDARTALAALHAAAQKFNEALDSGDWNNSDAHEFEKSLDAAYSWLIGDAHAAAARNSKKERANG